MTHEDLMEWMTKYPWLVVLDGLDEVPSSSTFGCSIPKWKSMRSNGSGKQQRSTSFASQRSQLSSFIFSRLPMPTTSEQRGATQS